MGTLSERLRSAREGLGLSQQQVADAAGMKQPSYYQLESGKTKRSRYINEIAKVLNTNADWLMYGIGHIPNSDHGNGNAMELNQISHVQIGTKSDYDLVNIQYLDIKASCGSGYANEEHPEAHSHLFTVEFLRANNLPIDGKGLVLMHACSYSMGYTIPHGTLMLVDTRDNEFDKFINDKVYVFKADSEMICKRAMRNLNGTIVLKSDNPDKDLYPDQLINRNTG